MSKDISPEKALYTKVYCYGNRHHWPHPSKAIVPDSWTHAELRLYESLYSHFKNETDNNFKPTKTISNKAKATK